VILDFSVPVVLRAKPPRCGDLRQVICQAETRVVVPAFGADEQVLAAFWTTERGRENIRWHDGRFYRRACERDEVPCSLAEFLRREGYLRSLYRPLLDVNNRLEYSDVTWPVLYEKVGRKRVTLDEAASFECVDAGDLLRLRADLGGLVSRLAIIKDEVWVECAEPCYRLAVDAKDQIGTVRPDFVGNAVGAGLRELYFQPGDLELATQTRHRLVEARFAKRDPNPLTEIEIVRPEFFTFDHERAGFLRLAGEIVQIVAAKLAEDAYREAGKTLLASAPEDIDAWNDLRRMLRALEAGKAINDIDERALSAAKTAWEKLGGGDPRHGQNLGPRHAAFWAELAAERWFDRRIGLNDTLETHPCGGSTSRMATP
jgi:hypothetical protein